MTNDLTQRLKAALEPSKDAYLRVIEDWKMYWMNQRQNSQSDYENYFRRAFGVDANMAHHLADNLSKHTRTHALVMAMVDLLDVTITVKEGHVVNCAQDCLFEGRHSGCLECKALDRLKLELEKCE